VNIVRLLPSLPGYIYAVKDDQLFINLFIPSVAEIDIDDHKIKIEQRTDYPWDGSIIFKLRPQNETAFTVRLRIPSWVNGRPLSTDLYNYHAPTPSEYHIFVNGQETDVEIENGYALISRKWSPDDELVLKMDMPVRKVMAHPEVKEDQFKVALERGPIVYCTEEIDNGKGLFNSKLSLDAQFEPQMEPALLNGLVALKGRKIKNQNKVLLIPYYAWAHRGTGKMAVWLPYTK
jgi:DUF1680 family protein